MRLALDPTSAIVDLAGGTACTADELARAAAGRAARLRAHGLGRGGHAVIAHGGTPAFFADLMAVWRTGACAACVNPGLADTELANVVDFLKPAVVLGGGDFAGDGLDVPVVRVGDPAGPDADGSTGPSALDDPALILFTSGTTGAPKGVVHSFRSLMARVALNRAHIGDATLATTLCVLPTHFGHGLIGNCLTPLMAGGRLLLFQNMGLADMAGLGGLIDEHGVRFLSSVPAFWKIARKAGGPPTRATLRQVNIGSAPLSAELWRAVVDWTGIDHVVNMYGITETANWAAGASARGTAPEDGLVGTVWGGRAAVLADDGTVYDSGDGEILLQTPALMTGYHDRPDLTEAVLRAGWYHTGDIGTVDAAGVIRLSGRAKSEINRAGIKVHPEEVDLLLERHPEVAEACTFGVEDAISGEIVGTAVCLAAGAAITPAELRAWCLDRMRRESVPERWYVVDRIPKTDRGKINRDAVKASVQGAGART